MQDAIRLHPNHEPGTSREKIAGDEREEVARLREIASNPDLPEATRAAILKDAEDHQSQLDKMLACKDLKAPPRRRAPERMTASDLVGFEDNLRAAKRIQRRAAQRHGLRRSRPSLRQRHGSRRRTPTSRPAARRPAQRKASKSASARGSPSDLASGDGDPPRAAARLHRWLTDRRDPWRVREAPFGLWRIRAETVRLVARWRGLP
jgi:hypothetical protein